MREEAAAAAIRPEAYPADADFPQLEIATDPARMLEVFREHLKPVSGRSYRIRACTPFRFRCRQSTSRCVLQYTLRVVEPETGREFDQWVTGLVYAEAGKAQQLWREMRDLEPRSEIPASWRTFEPVGFIPDLRMVVEIFPFDRRLPHLAGVLGGAARGFEPALRAALGPGEWQTEADTLEPTRYRTELGAALRYTLHARDTLTSRRQTLRCYLKVYRNERGEETFRFLREWAARAPERSEPYSLVQPLAYLSELRTLVLEEAPGVSLQQLLLERRDPADTMRQVARAVAAFHLEDLDISRPHTLSDQLDDVALASKLVEWACPEVAADARAITAAVSAGLQIVPPAPIHADLKADHIFLSGDRVTFIDLDSVARGDPARDPSHLCSYILGRVGLDAIPPQETRDAAAAFTEEYFRHVPAWWRAQFPLHCAGALVEVASGIFRRQEPQWREKLVASIAVAREVLSGGFP